MNFEQIYELLKEALAVLGQYKLYLFIGTVALLIVLFIDRLVAFLNALIDLCGKIHSILRKVFRFFRKILQKAFAGILFLITLPRRIYRLYLLRKSRFYVVPGSNQTTYTI